MLWKGSRESQSQAEVTGGSVNIPEGFRGEEKLSGSSSSFSIDVEDDSCQDPLQNHLCRGKQLKFQRLQAPGRCFLPLTRSSEAVHRSRSSPGSSRAPQIPLQARGPRAWSPQGLGDIGVPGMLRKEPHSRRCAPEPQQIKISREYVLL